MPPIALATLMWVDPLTLLRTSVRWAKGRRDPLSSRAKNTNTHDTAVTVLSVSKAALQPQPCGTNRVDYSALGKSLL